MEDAPKVLGHDSISKWAVVSATERLTRLTNASKCYLITACNCETILIVHVSFDEGHCSHAQLEDAPEVLGHASISKWAVEATEERRTSWSGGGTYENGGNKILPRNSIHPT